MNRWIRMSLPTPFIYFFLPDSNLSQTLTNERIYEMLQLIGTFGEDEKKIKNFQPWRQRSNVDLGSFQKECRRREVKRRGEEGGGSFFPSFTSVDSLFFFIVRIAVFTPRWNLIRTDDRIRSQATLDSTNRFGWFHLNHQLNCAQSNEIASYSAWLGVLTVSSAIRFEAIFFPKDE